MAQNHNIHLKIETNIEEQKLASMEPHTCCQQRINHNSLAGVMILRGVVIQPLLATNVRF